MANEKILAVGVEIKLVLGWLPPVKGAPASYKSAEAIQNWVAKEQTKRAVAAAGMAWTGAIQRIIFADPISYAVVFDSEASKALGQPAVAAYNFLLQDGLTVDPLLGMTSHKLFGWRLKSVMRPWGTELIYRVQRGEQSCPLPPLRFWHQPKRIFSIMPMAMTPTERRWIGPEALGSRLGLNLSPDASAQAQLDSLAKFSSMVDLAAAMTGDDFQDFGEDDIFGTDEFSA